MYRWVTGETIKSKYPGSCLILSQTIGPPSPVSLTLIGSSSPKLQTGSFSALLGDEPDVLPLAILCSFILLSRNETECGILDLTVKSNIQYKV